MHHNHATITNTNRMPRLGKKFLCRLSTLAGVAALSALTLPALNAAEEAASTPPPTPATVTSTTEKPAATPSKSPATDSDTVKLAPVVVEATEPPGSALRGYLEDNAKYVGPWGELSLQDTPYSMTVISQEFIQNSILANTNHLWEMVPNVYNTGFGADHVYGDGTTGIGSRGFGATGLVNGIRTGASGFFLEEMERIEINTGLTGFLYGGGYAGGSVNFVTKRPTAKQKTDINLVYNGGNSHTMHIDTSGPIWEGKLGYRINALYGEGEGAIEGINVQKKLISGAVDWNITKNMVLQFDAAYRENNRDGSKAYFANGPDGYLRVPINPNYSYQPNWTHGYYTTKKVGTNFEWKINEIFSLRAAYRWQDNYNDFVAIDHNNLSGGSQYYEGNFTATYDKRVSGTTVYGGYIYLNAKFDTTSYVHHSVTGGFTMNNEENGGPSNYYIYAGLPGVGNYYVKGSWQFPEPDWTSTATRIGGPWTVNSRRQYMNYAIGDEMIVKKDLILMLGYIYSNITTKSYNWRTGVPSGPSGMYDEGASSYTASAVYKATKDLSLYSTWIQATEAGTYVGLNASPRYRNEGEYLPPTQSDQFEIGAKYNWNGILFALSGFYINKANTFDDFHTDGTRTLTQDGREIRKGVEFSATGKLTKSLTVMTGATGFDATIKKTNNASQRGKTPGNTPLFLAKIYVEYELPFLKNLFITGGVFHTGSMYYNTNNIHKLTDVTTGDVGLRYFRKIKDFDVTFRFNVQNVTDEWYWRRSSLGDLGDPRTFTCSTTISF